MKARYTVTYEIDIPDHDEGRIKMIFYEKDYQALSDTFRIEDKNPSDRNLELIKKAE